jgi:hypothetical protein
MKPVLNKVKLPKVGSNAIVPVPEIFSYDLI